MPKGSPKEHFLGILVQLPLYAMFLGLRHISLPSSESEPPSLHAINEGLGDLHKSIDIPKRRCQSH